MDKERFINDWRGERAKWIIRYAFQQDGWFDYHKIVEQSSKEAVTKTPNAKKNYQGKGSKTRGIIKYMIKIGFLEAHPKKGLRVTPDFVPCNQR